MGNRDGRRRCPVLYFVVSALGLFVIANSASADTSKEPNADVGAVCDFISARIYEIENDLRVDPGTHTAPAKNRYGSVPLMTYANHGTAAVYFVHDNEITVISFRFSSVFPNSNRAYLLKRLGIDPSYSSDEVVTACDNWTLLLRFKNGILQSGDGKGPSGAD